MLYLQELACLVPCGLTGSADELAHAAARHLLPRAWACPPLELGSLVPLVRELQQQGAPPVSVRSHRLGVTRAHTSVHALCEFVTYLDAPIRHAACEEQRGN